MRAVPWWVWALLGLFVVVAFVASALNDDRHEVLPMRHDD